MSIKDKKLYIIIKKKNARGLFGMQENAINTQKKIKNKLSKLLSKFRHKDDTYNFVKNNKIIFWSYGKFKAF